MSSRTSTPLLRFFFFEELACSLLLWRQCDGGGPAGFSGVVLGIIVPASKLGLGIRVSPASDGILRIFFFFFFIYIPLYDKFLYFNYFRKHLIIYITK